MKKTIDLTDEALAIYDKWGHKKSEKASQAIIEYDGKTEPFTPEQESRIIELIKKELEKK